VSGLYAVGILLKLHGEYSRWCDDAAIGSSVVDTKGTANIPPAMLCYLADARTGVADVCTDVCSRSRCFSASL
jgi:hypothetical protein